MRTWEYSARDLVMHLLEPPVKNSPEKNSTLKDSNCSKNLNECKLFDWFIGFCIGLLYVVNRAPFLFLSEVSSQSVSLKKARTSSRFISCSLNCIILPPLLLLLHYDSTDEYALFLYLSAFACVLNQMSVKH